MFHRQWLLPLGVLVGYALLMGAGPVRHCLLDGARAIRRYQRLWAVPACFGICYALFHAALTLFFYIILPIEEQPAFGWKFSWAIPPYTSPLGEAHSLADWLHVFLSDPRWQVARDGGLDGIELLAGLFNNVVTTFPLSAVAAIMLLVNWQGHLVTLRKALLKRMGPRGLLVFGGIILCAVAAILAPFLFGPSLIFFGRVAPGLPIVGLGTLIDWLSSLFAYLFGMGVQVYLILVIYTWLRGITWTPVHLMDLAVRRFSFVVKWSAIVLIVSSLLVDLPRVFALLFRFDDRLFFDHTFVFIDRVGRPLLALFLIFFSTMQITLTFHSETLHKALAQHLQFIRRFWWQVLWFLLIAAIHLFGLAVLNRWLLLGFGGNDTTAGLVWSFIYPIIAALLAAWFLAAWVSLYKRCETGRVQAPDWIPF